MSILNNMPPETRDKTVKGFEKLLEALDTGTITAARAQSIEQARYAAGLADGVRRAWKLLAEDEVR